MNLSANEIVAIIGIIVGIFITVYAGMVYMILSGKIQNSARLEVEKGKQKLGALMLTHIGYAHWGDYIISTDDRHLEQAIALTERA